MTDLSTIERESPLRAIDWRWKAAQRVLASTICPVMGDGEIQAAVNYLTRSVALQADPVVAGARLAIAGAIRIQQGDPTVKAVVEANILARRSDDEIAVKVNVDPETVRWYEALFFHVRDRLDATDWIVATAIGKLRTRPSVLKRFAYFAGPHVLDAVQPYLVGIGKLASDSALDESIRNAIEIELLPDDDRANRLLSRLMLLVLQHERLQRLQQPGVSQRLGDMMTEAMLGKLEGRLLEPAGANPGCVVHTGASHGLGDPPREEVLLPQRAGGPKSPESLLRRRNGRLHGRQDRGEDQGRAFGPVETPSRRAG